MDLCVESASLFTDIPFMFVSWPRREGALAPQEDGRLVISHKIQIIELAREITNNGLKIWRGLSSSTSDSRGTDRFVAFMWTWAG